MPLLVDLDRLHQALLSVPGLGALDRADLEPLAGGGVAHDHVRIAGHGLLARVPRVSQLALAAADNLAYQAACFARLAPSGRVPRLAAVIDPGDLLPMGALVVEEIAGRPAAVPRDLTAIARTLAAIHGLPLPDRREPLGDHPDPVLGTWAVIQRQMAYFDDAPATARVRSALADEAGWAADFVAASRQAAQPRTLVGTDTHPGNFIVDAAGRAIFVDLEKALYGSPAIDVAHATLPTSVLWSAPGAVPVAAAEILAFEQAWLAALPTALALRLRSWVRPMRRLTWLRSMSWFARWWVLSRHDPAWSAERLDPALAAHIEGCIALFFTDAMVDRVRGEWHGADALPEPPVPGAAGPA